MTEIMERMRKVLRDTGLYSGEGKIMAAELAAYGAGLSILFDAIDALRRNMFIGTADAAEAADFLPAHLPCTLDFGRNTWDAVDARDMTFAQMDLKNRTWDEIDAM